MRPYESRRHTREPAMCVPAVHVQTAVRVCRRFCALSRQISRTRRTPAPHRGRHAAPIKEDACPPSEWAKRAG